MSIEHDALGKKERGINSKIKGNRGELMAARVITKWTGEKFTRTPMSGGLRFVNASMLCGDLICENQDFKFPFTVEVKFYQNFEIEPTLRSNSIIYKWWAQAVEDARRAAKEPMLMCRKNGQPKDFFYIFFNLRAKKILPLSLPPSSEGRVQIGEPIFGYGSTELVGSVDFTKFVNQLNNLQHG